MQNFMSIYLFIYKQELKGFTKTIMVPYKCPG